MTRDATVDDRFVAFADVERRRLLYYLCTAPDDHRVTFDGLVSRLAEDDGSGIDSRKQARMKLTHVHLPKLEQARLVERDGETVRLAVASDVVTEGLELARRFDPT